MNPKAYEQGYYAPDAPHTSVAWHGYGWVMRKRMDSDQEVQPGSAAAKALDWFQASGRQEFAGGAA